MSQRAFWFRRAVGGVVLTVLGLAFVVACVTAAFLIISDNGGWDGDGDGPKAGKLLLWVAVVPGAITAWLGYRAWCAVQSVRWLDAQHEGD